MIETATVQTREVLAGAYRAGQEKRAILTHSIVVNAEKTLCGRIKEERLADENAGDTTAKPTCPTCLGRDPRFKES